MIPKLFKLAFHLRVLYGQLTPHPPPGYSSVPNAPCQPRDKVTSHTSVTMLISEIKFQQSNGEFNLEAETVEIGGTDTVTPNLLKGPSKTRFNHKDRRQMRIFLLIFFFSFFPLLKII
jgi:hypothetical protein